MNCRPRTLSALHFAALLTPALAAGMLSGGVSAQSTTPTLGISNNASVVDNQVILFTKPGFPVVTIASALGATVADGIPEIGLHLLRFPDQISQQQLQQQADLLKQLPITILAEVDRRVEPPEVENCSGLANPGATVQQCTIGFVDGNPSASKFREQPWVKALGIPEAQHAAKAGTFALVAVIDTGIDPLHPALRGRLYEDGYDFIQGMNFGWDIADGKDNDGDGTIDEAYGHGTHIAGTIAAINPQAMFASYRVMNSDGIGSAYNVAKAIFVAINEGADVINLSLSIDGNSDLVSMALVTALNNGIDVYSSVGNTSAQGVLFPASLTAANSPVPLKATVPYAVVSVAAVDSTDKKAQFSAWGSLVDITAPGTNIYAPLPGGNYGWWSGTSMATAVASGVGSLAVSIKGRRGRATELVDSAIDIDSLNPGFGGLLGFGRLTATHITPRQ